MPNLNKEINKEELRQAVEKILWREYNPDYSPNFEEVSEEIVALFQQPEKEHIPDVGKKIPEWGVNEKGITYFYSEPKEACKRHTVCDDKNCYARKMHDKLPCTCDPEPGRDWDLDKINVRIPGLMLSQRQIILDLLLSERTASYNKGREDERNHFSSNDLFLNYIDPYVKKKVDDERTALVEWAKDMREKIDKHEYCKNEGERWENGYDCAMYDIISLLNKEVKKCPN